MPANEAFPKPLADAERALIDARRDTNEWRPVAGLAISGGGIRSATFGLGVLQALQERGLLRKFDYLSTVSGGGYIGSFLCSHFLESRKRKLPDGSVRFGWDAVDAELEPGGSELRWLRDNGRYLSPNGSEDGWLAAAVVLRNWVAVQTVLSIFLFSLFLSLNLGRAFVAQHFEPLREAMQGRVVGSVWLSPLFLVAAVSVLSG